MIDPVAELMRQGALDFVGDKPPFVVPASNRLLIMACSDTKAEGSDLPARVRYDGPLWQTLRAVDPNEDLAQVAYLSALLGLGSANKAIPMYNQRMTANQAQQMIERGICGWHPYRETLPATESGLAKYVANRPTLRTAAGEVAGMLRSGAGNFRDVAIVGGKLYVEVGSAFVEELREAGYIDADAKVTIINDQIGYMRSALRRWLMEPEGLQQAA